MQLMTGKFGATRQSWRRDSLRSAYAEIVAENPGFSHTKIVQLMAERAREEDDLLIAAMEYIVTNCEEAQVGYKKRQVRTPQQIKCQDEEDAASVKSIQDQIMLLNQEMPNGKRMRYCNGREMAKWGSAYAKIAKRVGPTKLVGSVLSEAQVRALVL